MMILIGSLVSAFADVRSRPLRTLAALGGMVAAVIAVMLIDASGALSSDASAEFLQRQFGAPVTANVTRQDTPTSAADAQQILVGNGFSTISIRQNAFVAMLGDNRIERTELELVSPSYKDIFMVDIVAGTWPEETASGGGGHLVVSEQFARNLGFFPPVMAIGQAVWLAPNPDDALADMRTVELRPYVIDAVASRTTRAFEDTPAMLVTTDPNPWLTGPPTSWAVRMNPVDFPLFLGLMELRDPTTDQQIFGWSRSDSADDLKPVLAQQARQGRVAQLTALTIGGLGILAVGLAVVRERGREYALRRALGATLPTLFLSVLLRSVIEAVVAAITAIPIAVAAVYLLARQLVIQDFPLPSVIQFPIRSAVLGVGSAAVVGLLAGIMPALAAVRRSVAQSLRS